MKTDPKARYAKTHEWAREEDGVYVVGISDYAQSTLSDIVYVELPEVGDEVSKGDEIAVVESVKAAGEVYAPLSGEIVEVNEELEDAPELINTSPFEKGWICKIEAGDEAEWDELLDVDAYEKVVEEEESH
jgi:glycine cleavage system H protein